MPTRRKKNIKTIWIERLNIAAVCLITLRYAFSNHEVFFNKQYASLFAVRMSAILSKVFSIPFNSIDVRMNAFDERGIALEYQHANICRDIANKYCQTWISNGSKWLNEMTKCYISNEIYYGKVLFIYTVIEKIKHAAKTSDHIVYLPGHHLNPLLCNYFGSKIKIKSVPNIVPALKCILRGPWYIMRNILQRILNFKIRGNICEKPSSSSIWIDYASGVIHSYIIDSICKKKDGGRRNAVCYMGSTEYPVTADLVSSLEKRGLNWIDTNSLLHSRFPFHKLPSMLMQLLQHVFRYPTWFAFFLFNFEVQRELYVSLYRRFNVKLLQQHQEASYAQEAQKQAIETVGGIMIGLHWSHYVTYGQPVYVTTQHVMFVWGEAHRNGLNIQGNTCSYILPCGLWLGNPAIDKPRFQPIEENRFVIAIFDSSAAPEFSQTQPDLSIFYMTVLDILEENKSFSGIIKSKKYDTVTDLKILPEGNRIADRMLSLEREGRLWMADRNLYSALDVAAMADLSVCFSMNSAGIIAGLMGYRAIHWDCIGLYEYPIYKDKNQKLFFPTMEETKSMLLKAVTDTSIGDFSKWRKNINYFDDDKGMERICRFIDIYMDLGANVANLKAAVEQYISEFKISEK